MPSSAAVTTRLTVSCCASTGYSLSDATYEVVYGAPSCRCVNVLQLEQSSQRTKLSFAPTPVLAILPTTGLSLKHSAEMEAMCCSSRDLSAEDPTRSLTSAQGLRQQGGNASNKCIFVHGPRRRRRAAVAALEQRLHIVHVELAIAIGVHGVKDAQDVPQLGALHELELLQHEDQELSLCHLQMWSGAAECVAVGTEGVGRAAMRTAPPC